MPSPFIGAGFLTLRAVLAIDFPGALSSRVIVKGRRTGEKPVNYGRRLAELALGRLNGPFAEREPMRGAIVP